MVGGNANKKMVISEAAQDRINRIFADSESDKDDDLIKKLDLMEKNDVKIKDKEPKLKFTGFTGRQIQKEFHCPVNQKNNINQISD